MAIEFSDANLGRIGYEREVDFGAANAPFTEQIARVTSSGLAANKETVVSDELRADRMVGDLIETGFSTGGDLGFELSLGGTWDDFLESLICGTYAAVTAFTGNLSVVASTQTFSDAATGGTLTANLVVGDYVFIGGMTNAGNNGWHRVATVASADSFTVETDVANLTDETTASGAATANSKTLKNPGDPTNIIKRSYNLEQYFTDTDIAQLFVGQRLGTMSLSTAANAIVSGSWSFMGTNVTVQEDLGDYATTVEQPTCTDVVSATANVGQLILDGVPTTCLVQSIDLSIYNSLRNQNAIGSKYPCNIGYGRQLITGTIVLYFQDITTYQAYLNHSNASLSWGYSDAAGNAMHVSLPRIKFATDAPSLEGVDTDVTESIDFQAIAYSEDCTDPAEIPYQIQITVANADGS